MKPREPADLAEREVEANRADTVAVTLRIPRALARLIETLGADGMFVHGQHLPVGRPSDAYRLALRLGANAWQAGLRAPEEPSDEVLGHPGLRRKPRKK